MRIFCYISLLLIFQVILKLPDVERQKLLEKYAKKISANNVNELLYLQPDSGLKYDKSEIDEIIQKYNFPSEYNFIKATGAPVHIKNQQNCGCCWAISSTTVLAYRFFKKGINLDLSPQHEISCYLKTCVRGNILIDPFLSLIINGTLTEECLQFSSGNKIIEECPSKCKDPKIEYKKYYAKNAYTIKLTQDNFYDVTTIIMDQLITNGPVMTSMEIFEDLYPFVMDENCPNEVYTYDGESDSAGGHAVTIVGYGFKNNKYYWLLQNSWGEKSCGDGFLKIEFGQVSVGSISFAEPKMDNEETGKIIKVSYNNTDENCNLEIKSDSNLDNWKNQLIIVYNHTNTSDEFKYICGATEILKGGKKQIVCNYEKKKENCLKGIYKYKTFYTTGTKNNFVFDETFLDKQFNYFGNDKIYPICSLYTSHPNFYIYISENMRRFYFLYEPIGTEHNLPKIYPNEQHLNNSLSNCTKTNITMNGYYISYCEVNNEEFEYFDKCETTGGNFVITQAYCNTRIYRTIKICRIDEKSHPIFKVHSFELVGQKSFSYGANLIATIEGNYNNIGENTFLVVIGIENGKDYKYDTMVCNTDIQKASEKNYKIDCNIDIFEGDKFDNIYAYPYYGNIYVETPFEIIINDVIKGNKHSN